MMHILSFLATLGILVLALGVIGAMLAGNAEKIAAALRGDDARQPKALAGAVFNDRLYATLRRCPPVSRIRLEALPLAA
jgi:hypothetical protein